MMSAFNLRKTVPVCRYFACWLTVGVTGTFYGDIINVISFTCAILVKASQNVCYRKCHDFLHDWMLISLAASKPEGSDSLH